MRFFSLFLLILTLGSANSKVSENSKDVEEVVQKVLEIEEFNQYFNRTPRFISSNRSPLYLLKNQFIPKDINLNVHNIPVMLLNPELQKAEDYKFFIKVEELKMRRSKSMIVLTYKNSKLLYEEKKSIKLTANLEKAGSGEWEIKNYDLQKISTSD